MRFFKFVENSSFWKNPKKFNVPEVLNVHVNESEKKIYFFSSSEKLTFEKENVIF